MFLDSLMTACKQKQKYEGISQDFVNRHCCTDSMLQSPGPTLNGADDAKNTSSANVNATMT